MSALGGTADTENELRVPLLAAQLLSIATPITGFACALYFWSRLAHVIVYTLGIPVLRTLAFAGRFAAQAGPASACDLQVELTASLLPLARTPTPKRKWRGQEPIKLPPPPVCRASDYPLPQRRCRSRARASLRTRGARALPSWDSKRGVAVRQGLRFLRAELPRILATPPEVLLPRMVRVIEGFAGAGWMSGSVTYLARSQTLARQDRRRRARGRHGQVWTALA